MKSKNNINKSQIFLYYIEKDCKLYKSKEKTKDNTVSSGYK